MSPTVDSTGVEESRIRAAYARRADAGLYSWFNPAYLLRSQECERRVIAALRRYGYSPLAGRKILEVGCGRGSWLRDFVKWGARPHEVAGVDLLPDRVAEARALAPSGMTVLCGSATRLDFPDASFDLVLQATVFTSILDAHVRSRVAAEMLRVLKPDGIVLWYDFFVDNPRNPDVRGVTAREIRRLFPGCAVELRRITLAPPLGRLLAPHFSSLYQVLQRVPFLCTHYLGVVHRHADRAAPTAPLREPGSLAPR